MICLMDLRQFMIRYGRFADIAEDMKGLAFKDHSVKIFVHHIQPPVFVLCTKQLFLFCTIYEFKNLFNGFCSLETVISFADHEKRKPAEKDIPQVTEMI